MKILIFIIFLIPSICFSKNVVVVHPSGFEGSEQIYDFANIFLKENDNIYWIKSSPEDTWPFKTSYDFVLEGPAGYFELEMKGQVYVLGGYYRACYKNAITCLNTNKDLKIVIPIEGVYYGTKRTLKEQIEANKLQTLEVLSLLGIKDTSRISLYNIGELKRAANFSEQIQNYKNAVKELCDSFGIDYNPEENIFFLDKTEMYWVDLYEDHEILWAERIETIENDDCEGSYYVSNGPLEHDKDSRLVLYLVQDEYETFYVIFNKSKKVDI